MAVRARAEDSELSCKKSDLCMLSDHLNSITVTPAMTEHRCLVLSDLDSGIDCEKCDYYL